jgi:hypothetical protein
VDLGRDLWRNYGCDELDVLECIQTAEDIWNVSLVPSPYSSEVSEQIERYRTLASTSDLASTLEGGQQTRSVTRGSARATTLLTALGITILEPLTPPKGAETVME